MKYEPLAANLRKSIGVTGKWQRRKPLPNEATGPYARTFVPFDTSRDNPPIALRPGADDHKRHSSKIGEAGVIYRDRGHL